MNNVIAWFTENTVAANMMMLLILVGGGLALPNTPKEMIPKLQLDMISITAPYPGASPTDVEEAICSRIESAIYDLEGIDRLNSIARENVCAISVGVAAGFESRILEEKIKSRVSAITTFPVNAGIPVVKQLSNEKVRVAKIVVAGSVGERALKEVARNVRSDLLELSEITNVELSDVRKYEISIEVSETSLQRYGLTFAEVAQAIRQNSVKASSGEVAADGGSISITTEGQAYTGEDYESIVLRAFTDGGRITVGDVATVIDGFEHKTIESRYNGEKNVSLSVYQVGNQSILEIAEALYEYVDQPTTYLPDGVTIALTEDASKYFRSRIELLSENALSGLVLVFITLLLFLNVRLSFWVTMGIPIAFLGAFWVLPYYGGTINMISTFAFLLVLGIVVDDAVIIGENIYSYHDQGIFGSQAAMRGAQDIAKPVVFAILTTILAFFPLLFVPGVEGQLFLVIPVVVIATLIFSLIECLLILPAHLAGIEHPEKEKDNVLTKVQTKFSNTLDFIIKTFYQPLLNKTLSWRYTAVIIFIGTFFVSIALMAGGWVKITLFSVIEADVARVEVTYPKGTSIDITRDTIDRIEAATKQLREELVAEVGTNQVTNIRTTLGKKGDHHGMVMIDLAMAEERKVAGDVMMKRLRELVGPIPGANKVTFDATVNPQGPDLDIELSGYELEQLRAAAETLKQELGAVDGVFDIRDSFQSGKQEVFLHLKPQAHDLGLTINDFSGQVRQAFLGVEVQSVLRGQDEVKVFVRYPNDERNSLWHLENTLIRLQDGSKVPLLSVADVSYGFGPAEIQRHNRKRIIRVSAYVDPLVTSSSRVMRTMKQGYFETMAVQHPSVRWSPAGAQKSRQETMGFVLRSYALTVVAMYVLMAVLFRSYAQPIMVMTAIPFGIVGAMFGHVIMGMELTLWSLIGMIAVSGVVVNDNFVLIDFINRQREAGVRLLESIRHVGAARFRPVMLTSITTFVGLVPLIMEKSVQAQFLVPMAVSLAYGVMFATLVSLLLVPALYHILDDMQQFWRRYMAASTIRRRYQVDEDEIEIDEAYQYGYAQALSRRRKSRQAPFQSEVLSASWEAGWDDGVRALKEGRRSYDDTEGEAEA